MAIGLLVLILVVGMVGLFAAGFLMNQSGKDRRGRDR